MITFALIPAGKCGQEGMTNDNMVFTLKGLGDLGDSHLA